MQTWAKRGMQTALVTGGLLMLGTGIASANENVNPDLPASPIDGGASVPVHVGDNAVGTPLGQVKPATVDRTISTDGLPDNGPAPVGANRAKADVVAPVDVSGNAVAAGGDATVASHSHQSAGRSGPVVAGRAPGSLAGNVVEVNHSAPVQITGNAVSVAGTATSINDAGQSATTGGDTTTNGAGHPLAGNVLAEQGATPVQVDGNAIAGGGQARTLSTTSSTAKSNGSIGTSGAGGTGAGNVGAVPVALPVEVTDQAVSGAGNANSAGRNTVVAHSGDNTRRGYRGWDYVDTNGDPSTLSGNAVVPGVANPAVVTCNAAGAIGNSDSECATTNTDTAGGVVATRGAGSTGSGNVAMAPVSEPAEVFGNGASAIGNANSGASNTERSTALGNGFTLGDGSAASANDVTAPMAGANDVFANGVSGIGNAAGTADNEVNSTSGGYSGTTGTGGTGSGNIGQIPVAAPVEAYGTSGSAAGNATGTVPDETKQIRAGGSPNARDDNGTASSNVVSMPAALPAQVFGDAAGVAANTSSVADSSSTVYAGGDPTATGRAGTGSGNVVTAPAAIPAQVFNDGASVVGNGTTTGFNDTTAGSGGTATANGSDGTVAGNVVNVPDAGPIQAFGVAAASPGNEEADSLSNTYTTAGDNTVTDGDRGALAGNVVTAQVSQVEQVLATGLAGAGNSTANGFNDTATKAGGNVRTSGEWGALSGDLVNVPATDVTQAAADGASALGNQWAFTHSTTSAASGGTSRTSGDGFLDGTPVIAPLGVDATVFRVPVDVIGRAVEGGYHTTSLADDDTAPQVWLPFGQEQEQQFGPSDSVDDLLRADQVPGLAGLFGRRVAPPMSPMEMTQVFPVLSNGIPNFSTMELTQQMPALPSLSTMEMTQQMPVIPGARTAPRPTVQNMPTPRTTPYQPYQPPYQPMTGELPVSGSLPGPKVPGTSVPLASANLPSVSKPAVPSAPNLSGMPDLPPVPTLPAMPPLPSRPSTQAGPAVPGLPSLPTPSVGTPQVPAVPALPRPQVSGPVTDGLPTGALGAAPSTQDVPAGAAQQLMAQLRGLISELENSGGGSQLHPMNVTELQEPPRF
jgi:hypothetical protein